MMSVYTSHVLGIGLKQSLSRYSSIGLYITDASVTYEVSEITLATLLHLPLGQGFRGIDKQALGRKYYIVV